MEAGHTVGNHTGHHHPNIHRSPVGVGLRTHRMAGGSNHPVRREDNLQEEGTHPHRVEAAAAACSDLEGV